MSDGTGDAPRLPPRPARDPDSQQLALDLAAVRPTPASDIATDWPAFEEPPLESLDWARRGIAVARLMSLGWGVAMVVFAFRLRSDAHDGVAGNSSIEALAVTGVVVAIALAFTGWRWSDRVTRNVHHMGGRLPNRARCARAWSLPIVCAGLLWVTVFQMDPTEVVDVRPAIVVTVMTFAIWRPYALLRRIIATLSRLRSDAVIAIGYVFDFSAFALLGWQLSTWPSAATPVSQGRADTFLGVSAAAAIGLALNLVNWGLLTGAVEAAEADRLLALRTRHDHRHLRLRGINPMDPDVRWALLKVRQQEELERRWRQEVEAAALPAPQPAARNDVPAIAPVPAAQLAPEPTATEPDLVESANRGTSSAAVPDVEQRRDDLVEARATEIISEKEELDAVEQVEQLEVAEAHAEPASEPEETEPRESFGEMAARVRSRLTGDGDQRRAPYPTIEPAQTGAGVSRLARSLDETGVGSAPSRRASFATRISAATGSGDDADLALRRDRFVQRLNDTGDGSRPDRTLLDRLNEYGITPNPDAAQPAMSMADEFRRDEERWIPPRLYELESVRYLMLVGIVVVAVTSAWIVVRTASAGDALIGGEIGPRELERINTARRAFVTALSITLGLVPLWGAVFLSHARRAGMPAVREWRGYALLAVAVALNVVSFVFDGEERGTASLVCLCGCLAAALATVAIVMAAARWFQRRTIGLVVWGAGLAFVTIASWVGGLQRPVDASHALEALTFVAALQSIATAVVLVIAALNTSDLEEAIRLSPEMQERPRPGADEPATP